MSTGGGRPATSDLVKVMSVSKHSVYLTGTNAESGKPVVINRVGETEYFKEGESFKVTYEPLGKD